MTKRIPRAVQPVIIGRYLAKEPTSHIAADYGVTPETIRNVMRRNQVPLRGRGGANNVRGYAARLGGAR